MGDLKFTALYSSFVFAFKLIQTKILVGTLD